MSKPASTDRSDPPNRKRSDTIHLARPSSDPFNFMNHALEKWADEGGALAQDSMHREYGKRIEADGSWTVYHVFTGSPATIGGDLMQGMNAKNALDQMMKTNSGNSSQRAARTFILKAPFLVPWWGRLTKFF